MKICESDMLFTFKEGVMAVNNYDGLWVDSGGSNTTAVELVLNYGW